MEGFDARRVIAETLALEQPPAHASMSLQYTEHDGLCRSTTYTASPCE